MQDGEPTEGSVLLFRNCVVGVYVHIHPDNSFAPVFSSRSSGPRASFDVVEEKFHKKIFWAFSEMRFLVKIRVSIWDLGFDLVFL